MILVEAVVGNVRDGAWKAALDGATVDVLHLDQWAAQKNRLRRKSEGGEELAIALERNTHLHDGDILVWDEAKRVAIVARIQLQDVLVIHLQDLLGHDQEVLARTCFELGHALGNQHWPAVVKGTTVYVPLTVDRKVMASVMKTHAFAGITYEFIPGSEVIPYLAPHEARRLFGGADSTPHSHVHQTPGVTTHTHTDAEGRTYTHTHAHGTDHHHGPGHTP
jgi:urease accessory protein